MKLSGQNFIELNILEQLRSRQDHQVYVGYTTQTSVMPIMSQTNDRKFQRLHCIVCFQK
jgi:hypothetical protein